MGTVISFLAGFVVGAVFGVFLFCILHTDRGDDD